MESREWTGKIKRRNHGSSEGVDTVRETETVLDPFPPRFTNLKNTALVIEI